MGSQIKANQEHPEEDVFGIENTENTQKGTGRTSELVRRKAGVSGPTCPLPCLRLRHTQMFG